MCVCWTLRNNTEGSLTGAAVLGLMAGVVDWTGFLGSLTRVGGFEGICGCERVYHAQCLSVC